MQSRLLIVGQTPHLLTVLTLDLPQKSESLTFGFAVCCEDAGYALPHIVDNFYSAARLRLIFIEPSL
jgi:hypothetical protein